MGADTLISPRLQAGSASLLAGVGKPAHEQAGCSFYIDLLLVKEIMGMRNQGGEMTKVIRISKLAIGIGMLLLGLLVGPLAFAHAELQEASPAIGAIYRWNRPTEVRLSFTQGLEEADNSIIVTNRAFEEMQEGRTQLDPDDPYTIFVPLPTLSHGTYTVNWESNSVDGHALKGSYEFTIFSREPIITRLVAGIVLLGFITLVYTRRARPEDIKP